MPPHLTPPLATLPLAQLSDLLPTEIWLALYAAGCLSPLLGAIISLALRGPSTPRLIATALFYLPTIPLAAAVLLAHPENPAIVCSFLLLLPTGILLGLILALAPKRTPTPRPTPAPGNIF